VENVRAGNDILTRIVQKAQLVSEYKALQKGKAMESSRSLSSLSPFLDEHGAIRLGSGLRNSTLAFEARHPVVF